MILDALQRAHYTFPLSEGDRVNVEIKEGILPSRIWTTRQIWLASFFGGPFGGCYLLRQNYKTFGNAVHAKRSLVVGIFSTFLLMMIYGFWDELPQGFLRSFIPMAYTMLIWEFAKRSQGSQIKEMLASGVKRSSYWKLVGISFATLASMFAICCCIGAVQILFE